MWRWHGEWRRRTDGLKVLLGAGGELKGKYAARLCKFFGDISYPLYITHYPFIYIYTGWVYDAKPPLAKAVGFGVLVLFSSITLAYACLKLYDEPVRRWLTNKLVTGTKEN